MIVFKKVEFMFFVKMELRSQNCTEIDFMSPNCVEIEPNCLNYVLVMKL